MKLYKKSLGLIGTVFCVLLLLLSLTIAPTQARYDNAVSWMSIYDPGVQKITSNYLNAEGQTVMLQPWKATAGTSRTKEITISASKGTADVELQCSTSSPYITAQLDSSTARVTGSGYIATLRMTATDAVSQLTQRQQASVTVTMRSEDGNTTLRATFQMTLLPGNAQEDQAGNSTLETAFTISPERSFAWKEKLIFTLTAEQNADSVELMYNGGVFPAGTRYRIGQSRYNALADAMKLKFPVTAGTATMVVLDFSQADVTVQPSVTLTATAYLNGLITGKTDFTVSADRQPLDLDTSGMELVICGGESLDIPMTGDEEGLISGLEYLTQTNSGIVYTESTELNIEVLTAQQILRISNTTGKAPAGTYRLTLARMFDGQIVSICQMVFFVHY